MPTLKSTPFTAYNFTKEEYAAACQLSGLTRLLIQSMMAAVAEQRLHVVFDATNPTQFAQTTAELDGRLTAYQELLDLELSLPKPTEGV